MPAALRASWRRPRLMISAAATSASAQQPPSSAATQSSTSMTMLRTFLGDAASRAGSRAAPESLGCWGRELSGFYYTVASSHVKPGLLMILIARLSYYTACPAPAPLLAVAAL